MFTDLRPRENDSDYKSNDVLLATFYYVHKHIVTCISDLYLGFALVNRFIGYSLVVTTSNYNTFKITVIIAYKVFKSQVKSSQADF
jgi:hypothetical protein